MKPLKWTITASGGLVLLGLLWFGIKAYRCRERNADFAQRIERITQDAEAQLKVGTKKADVMRFYTERHIPFNVDSMPSNDGLFEVTGTLNTIGGCAPLGCGTNQVLIEVRVKLDADGNTRGVPEVVDLYTDCL